ncbi:MAG: WbqC-like protein family protein [Parcubacteria group bacterium GW2011_GWA2_47_64]|nr:MAG: WbqC-like protein family protein [Parcubacteria group bacterium GW2011_GWA2_47_64]KKU96543.1 MAG: WbqC-like protein family protein [Parcubacteria group bacterium GW2011_GWC2_48_17]
MRVTIHQPEYLPYLGFFDRLLHADTFVLLDTAQFQRGGFINRNRIKTPKGSQWLTVPIVGRKKDVKKSIQSVRIDSEKPWQEEHIRAIELNYKKAPHFQEFFPDLRELLLRKWEGISELDSTLIEWVVTLFGLSIHMVQSSALSITGSATDQLVSICAELGADTYVSGPGGRNYLEMDKFSRAGIKVDFHNFEHPIYEQRFGGTFEPNLSVIDYIFNCGPRLPAKTKSS